MERARSTSLTVLCLVFAAATGCTHVQLRRNTLGQAQAAHDLQQQQVLDNLAMFVVDPNAVPYFTVAGSGNCSITDQGGATTALAWLRTGFQSVGLNLSASRLMQENFSLVPLNEPDKLARMRCAYQAAVGYEAGSCIDCCALEKQLGDPAWDGRPATGECPDECAPRPGWYCVGCKSDVPDCAPYVGCYKGTYVWVPASGSDDLARLTLKILFYATFIPGNPPTKTVTTTIKRNAEDIRETTIQETVVLPLQSEEFRTADMEGLPKPSGGAGDQSQPWTPPIRQNFMLPQQGPQVVIPVQ